MAHLPEQTERLVTQLLNGLLNGTLTADEQEQLDELIRTDSTARDRYMATMVVEAELHSLHAGTPVADLAVADLAVVNPTVAEPAVAVAANHAQTRRSQAGKRWQSYAALAASLIGVAALSSYATHAALRTYSDAALAGQAAEAHRTESHATETEEPAVQQLIGRITATRNCRWHTPTDAMGFGAKLYAGRQLNLDAGIAEITFENGAKVLIEGPATLDLKSQSQAMLKAGQLSATVPQQTTDFWLSTPQIGVGDSRAMSQAAEFGLVANAATGGEVHVFRGVVQAHLIGPAGTHIKTLELNHSEAARVRPAATSLAKFFADDDQFVRSIFSGAGPHDGLYAYEAFNYPGGPLSWQNGGFGWAGPWADIEATNIHEAPTNRVTDGSLRSAGLHTLGGRAVQTGQHNRIRRALSTSLGGVFDAAGLIENRDGHRLIGTSGKTVYLSFLQRVNQTDDVFYGFELHRGDGNGNRVLCVGNGADGAGYGVTSNYNAYGPDNYPKLGQEDTQANLIVVRIDYGENDRDHVTVYRNPESLLDESACKSMAELKGNFAFDRISLGNFDGTKIHEVDEVRIGTAFRAVTGQRNHAPSSPLPSVATMQGDRSTTEVLSQYFRGNSPFVAILAMRD